MAQRGRGAATGSRPAARRGVGPSEDHLSLRDAGQNLVALRARVRSIVAPAVAAAGLDLEDVSVTRAGRRHVVRVTVDSDGGVGHDELSDVSHDISVGLDAAEESGGELTTGAYTLELSSPGVDRPLTLARHWRRNVGRLVKVRASGRTVTARIATVDDLAVTLDDKGRTQIVAFDDLGPGHVQIEFRELASETIEQGRERASETIERGRERASETIERGRDLAKESSETGGDGADDDGDGPREEEEGA